MPVVGIKTRACMTVSHIPAKASSTFPDLKLLSHIAGVIEKERR